jgi:hypothetical protein
MPPSNPVPSAPAAAVDTTPAPPPTVEAVAEPDGCAVCSSPDVTYSLSTDVTGALIRIGFCSIECLAQKLGFVRGAAQPGEPSRMTGT